MTKVPFSFSTKTYPCYFDAAFSSLKELTSPADVIIITDENLASNYSSQLSEWKTIVIKPGEENKQQATVDHIIYELISLKADKQTLLIGLGGGVVTDITGYVASVYMRGIKFGLIPTSILGMVDAAVGGKSGIDVGVYKNIIGLIRHPEFLLYDFSFLNTLPAAEWVNGFAEIIKHACIKDEKLFEELEQNSLQHYRQSKEAIASLIKRNVEIKYSVVSSDEMESNERKLLNFGHTLGHSIENIYHLPHGHAVSIGMAAAATISESLCNFTDTKRLTNLIEKYHLPAEFDFNKQHVWDILLLDKKKAGDSLSFIVLTKIGDGKVKPIPIAQLKEFFDKL
jgi:3-dehydroquinate synthase